MCALPFATSIITYPLTTVRVDTENGREVFRKACSSCHAIRLNDAPAYGPALYEIGAVSSARRPGMSGADYILESVLSPAAFRAPGSSGEMPENIAASLSDNELRNVTAYLCSTGGTVNVREIAALKIARPVVKGPEAESLDLESIEFGKSLFLGRLKCSECHSLENVPGSTIVAPSLGGVGLHKRDYLNDALMNPAKHVSRVYQQVCIDQGGVLQTGRVLNRDGESITFIRTEGVGGRVVETIPITNLEPVGANGAILQQIASSPMPSYAGSLSAEEAKALIDFLRTMR